MKSMNLAHFSIYRTILPLLQYKKHIIPGFLIISYFCMVGCFLKEYLITDFTVWAALVLSFYIIRPDNFRKGKKRYLILSVFMLVSSLISGVKTFYFLSLGLAILFVIENLLGSIGYLPLFLLGLLSPTFKYFNNILGFPIRLKLSEWAGNMLMLLGYKIEVNGNVLILNGAEFSVDPACVGLKMMAVSILAGLLIMANFQHESDRPFHFLKISAILVLIIGFNIAGNLVRIMLLTVFQILPDNPSHEVVGVLCFLIYIILPSYVVIRLITKRYSGHRTSPEYQNTGTNKGILLNAILFACILLTGCVRFGQQKQIMTKAPEMSMAGYTKDIVKGEVLKFEKSGILIYIKPIQSFYSADHSPMICWVGSGYKFDRINKKVIGNKEVYSGILRNGNDLLFTAWWFDNGRYCTNNQADWRWRTVRGEKFYLVNVTAENEVELNEEIIKLLRVG